MVRSWSVHIKPTSTNRSTTGSQTGSEQTTTTVNWAESIQSFRLSSVCSTVRGFNLRVMEEDCSSDTSPSSSPPPPHLPLLYDGIATAVSMNQTSHKHLLSAAVIKKNFKKWMDEMSLETNPTPPSSGATETKKL